MNILKRTLPWHLPPKTKTSFGAPSHEREVNHLYPFMALKPIPELGLELDLHLECAGKLWLDDHTLPILLKCVKGLAQKSMEVPSAQSYFG